MYLCDPEWLFLLLSSAMYAGVFICTLNKGDFFYCEGRPCTAPLSGWFIFVCLVVKLVVIYGPFSAWFHWTRLKVIHLRLRRLYWVGQFSRTSYNLTLGYLHVVSSWYSSGKVGKGFPPLAKGRLVEIWKKNILAFQHQSPEWDESSRPGSKERLLRMEPMDIWERLFVLWCCIKIGRRLVKRCLLTKDGHNRQFATLCQESYCGGVHRPTLTKRPPQRLCCSPPAKPGNRGERLHWNNRSSMTAMPGADDLLGLLPSSFRLFIGTYLAQNPMTGEGCEALNIFILYLALSKVQLHVGINILHGASIKLPPVPMISAIFDYLLSTPALGMPFRTWFQTLLRIALISGITE